MAVDVGSAVGYLDLDIQGFLNGLKQAESEADGKSKSMSDKVSSAFTSVGSKLTSVGTTMSLGITTPLVAAGTAIVKTTSTFDSSMSKVSAISGATGDDLQTLRDKAKEMGASTKFSASEAADAFTYMAMAGWKTEAMLDGIDGIMSLAAADGLDLATTSDIVTDALTAFGLSAADSSHFADVLAKASSSANTNVSLLGESFKYAAPVAGALGYTAEDTAVALGLMANAGIKGSQGGTALRASLSRLIKPTDEVAVAMEAYGISMTEADGSMKPLSGLMDTLREKLGGLSEAEQAQAAAVLFGQEAMSGMLAIINTSSDDYDNLVASINNAEGAASSMADTMINNVGGQFTILKSELEGLMVSFGEAIVPYVTKAIGKISELIEKFQALSPAQKDIIVKIAAVAAVIGPVLVVVGKLATGIKTIINVVKTLKTAFSVLNAVMMANPIGIIIAAVATLVAAFIYLWNNCEGFREFWINLWEGIKNVAVNVWTAVSDFFVNVWESIKTFFVDTWNSIGEFAANAWNSIIEGIHTFIDGAIEFLSNLPYNIGLMIGTIIGKIILFVKDMGEKAIELGRNFVENIVTFFKELPGKIAEFINNVASKIKQWATELPQKAREMASRFLQNVVEFFQQLPGKISDFVSRVINTITSWVKNMTSKAKEAAKNFTTNLVNGIKELPNKVLTIGKNIVEGLWNGIKGATSWLYNKVKEFAKGILDGIKKTLGIGSPSKVARDEIGKWLPPGISIGFEAAMPAMLNNIRDSFNSGIKRLRGKLQTLELAGSAFGGGFNFSASTNGIMLIDYDLLSMKLAEILRLAPIQPKVYVITEDGDVILDGERVGRKVAPVVSRVIASGEV